MTGILDCTSSVLCASLGDTSYGTTGSLVPVHAGVARRAGSNFKGDLKWKKEVKFIINTFPYSEFTDTNISS